MDQQHQAQHQQQPASMSGSSQQQQQQQSPSQAPVHRYPVPGQPLQGARSLEAPQTPVGNNGPLPPSGYYPPMYSGAPGAPQTDPTATSAVASAYRGYDPAAYGMPPPHHIGYPPPPHPMYAYQPPMYGGYSPYPPPPHPAMGGYGYTPTHPSMMPQQQQQSQRQPPTPNHGSHPSAENNAGSPQRYGDHAGGNVGPAPFHIGTTADPTFTKYKGKDPNTSSGGDSKGDRSIRDDQDSSDCTSEDIVPGAVTARLRTYIRPRNAISQDNRDRRARKNAQSRARAAKLRERIAIIETKPPEERNEEEKQIWLQYEKRRQKKNDRSRERALEKKEEIDRILAKPEAKRTKIEKNFLDTALSAKKRKNEGDRLRRQRMKDLGLSSKASMGLKPGVSARGPLPYGQPPPPPPHMVGHSMGHSHHPYGHMGEIPMSPMPTMGHGYHQQSPAAFASPGMAGYSSPQNRSRPSGTVDTPGRSRADGGNGSSLPFIPPQNAYDASSPAATLPRNHPNRVEHRRNADGSMSISIGGGAQNDTDGHAPSFGGEAVLSDVPNLFYGENGDPGQPHDDGHLDGKLDS